MRLSLNINSGLSGGSFNTASTLHYVCSVQSVSTLQSVITLCSGCSGCSVITETETEKTGLGPK
jgi:hypothetical protein